MDRLKTRLSQALSITGVVSTLVVAGVMLIVGVVVFSKVKDAMPDLNDNVSLDSAEETQINDMAGVAYDSFELATVGIIVLAASAIIAILLGAFGSR